jgi:hypothetical protein
MEYKYYEVTMQRISLFTAAVAVSEKELESIDSDIFFNNAINDYGLLRSMDFKFNDGWDEILQASLIKNPKDKNEFIILEKISTK